jgi:hypothetical protein
LVFLNSPCWETHKNAIKTIPPKKRHKKRYLPTPFGLWSLVFGAPWLSLDLRLGSAL